VVGEREGRAGAFLVWFSDVEEFEAGGSGRVLLVSGHVGLRDKHNKSGVVPGHLPEGQAHDGARALQQHLLCHFQGAHQAAAHAGGRGHEQQAPHVRHAQELRVRPDPAHRGRRAAGGARKGLVPDADQGQADKVRGAAQLIHIIEHHIYKCGAGMHL